MTKEERIAATLAEVRDFNSLHQQEETPKAELRETLSSLYEIGIMDIPGLLKHIESTDNDTFIKVLNALVVYKLSNVKAFSSMPDSEIISTLQEEEIEGRFIRQTLSAIKVKRGDDGINKSSP